LIVALYILIQTVSIGTLPGLATSERPLADVGARILGTPGGAIIAAGALISVTGTLNVIVMVSPRLLFAMAERGQFPAALAATHPRFRTPWVAILISSLVVLVLTLQGSFIGSLTISTLIRLVTYAAVCLSLPILRSRPSAPVATFRAPAGPIVSVAALVLCAWLVSTSATQDLMLTLYATVAGFVLWFLFKARGSAARNLEESD
jgi:amino acid transporter